MAAEEYARLGRSLTGYRGHYTRALATLNRSIAWAGLQPVAMSMAVTNLTANIEAVERQFAHVERLSDIIVALPAVDGPTAIECTALITRVTEASLLLETAREGAAAAIARHEVALPLPAADAGPAIPADGAGAGLPRTIRPNTALKPEKLTRDHTPVEFRVWRNAFAAYYASSRMDASDRVTQRAYFYASLDTPLVSAVEARCQQGTPVFGENLGAQVPGQQDAGQPPVQPGANLIGESCMSILVDIFALQYPVHSRRLTFFRFLSTPGQSFMAWYDQLRQIGDEADLDRMDTEDLYVMRCLVSASSHPKLREKFMELNNKTLENLLNVVRNYESGQKDIKASERDYNAQSANKRSNGNNNNATTNATQSKGKSSQKTGGARQKESGSGGGTNEKLRDKLRRDNLCFRCGQDREHRPSGTCTAKDKKCGKCGTVGHISKTCLQGGTTNVKSNAVHATYAAAAAHSSTPIPVNGLGLANLALGRSAPLKQAPPAFNKAMALATTAATSAKSSSTSTTPAPAPVKLTSSTVKTLAGRKTTIVRTLSA